MITEYVGGGDLNDLLLKTAKSAAKRLSDSQVALIIKHVLKGLRHIHSHEIVHRDIKPSKILCFLRLSLKVVRNSSFLKKICSCDPVKLMFRTLFRWIVGQI